MLLKKLQKHKEPDVDEIIIHIHHVLNTECGWIPLDELNRTPAITVLMQYKKIIEKWERERKEYEKAKSRKR